MEEDLAFSLLRFVILFVFNGIFNGKRMRARDGVFSHHLFDQRSKKRKRPISKTSSKDMMMMMMMMMMGHNEI